MLSQKIFQVWSHDDVIQGKFGQKFFHTFLNKLKSLDSKHAIKKFATKIWIIHEVTGVGPQNVGQISVIQ